MTCTVRKLCGNAECDGCFQRSIASHPWGQHWSDRNDVPANVVFRNSHTTFWFDCETCKHTFDLTPNNLMQPTRGCPFCATPTRRLCEDIDCDWCFRRSFASSAHAHEWSACNQGLPRSVPLSSNAKYHFDCGKCKHTFEAGLNKVTEGKWCPFCGFTTHKLCADTDCAHCHSRSFASCAKAVNWCPTNKKTPRETSLFCQDKAFFVCGECNTRFQSIIASVACGTFCGVCKHKTEKKMTMWLRETFPELKSTMQATFDWCPHPKKKQRYRFDFAIEALKLIVEIDGRQHFHQVSNWDSPEDTQARDTMKSTLAMANGYTVVRVLQEDVYADRGDWDVKLKAAIRLHEFPTTYTILTGKPSTRAS